MSFPWPDWHLLSAWCWMRPLLFRKTSSALRERGEIPGKAALEGTGQVQGALLASTATTVAIFLPVLFLQDVEGQLFADLALTIAIAVCVSLLVALTILPTVAGNWLKPKKFTRSPDSGWSRITGFLMKASSTPLRRTTVIATLVAVPLFLTWALFPQLDYLPPVKRDAVDAFLQTPPGATWNMKEEEIVSTAGRTPRTLHEWQERTSPQELLHLDVRGRRNDRRPGT